MATWTKEIPRLDGEWFWMKNSRWTPSIAMGKIVHGVDGKWTFHFDGFAPYDVDGPEMAGSEWMHVPKPGAAMADDFKAKQREVEERIARGAWRT